MLAITNVAKQYEKLTSKLASIQAFIEDVCGSGFGTALRLLLKSGQDDFIAKENDLVSLVQDYNNVRSRVKEESEGFVAEVERRGKAASARGAAATPQKNDQLEGLEQRRAAQASAVQQCEQELARAEAAAAAARAEQQARREREERAAPVKQLKQTKRLRFDAKLRQKQREFHQGTRAWAFDELGAWLKTDSPKKLFWLKVGMCVRAAFAVRRSVANPPTPPHLLLLLLVGARAAARAGRAAARLRGRRRSCVGTRRSWRRCTCACTRTRPSGERSASLHAPLPLTRRACLRACLLTPQPQQQLFRAATPHR